MTRLALVDIVLRIARSHRRLVDRFGVERATRNAQDAIDVNRRAVDSVERQLLALQRREEQDAAA